MRFILLIFFGLFAVAVCAQQRPAYDSAVVDARSFNMQSIDSFKSLKDFQYERQQVVHKSLWDRFWEWFWEKYDEIMSTESGRRTMNIVYILLALFAVGFFVYRVMRMNRVALFASNVPNPAPYSIEEENIHQISFEEAIKEATSIGNYRLAIRLLYLQNLKLLSDKNLIAWLPGKTNADYKKELQGSAIGESFSNITRIFEDAWYGHRAIVKDDFERLGLSFINFKNQLN